MSQLTTAMPAPGKRHSDLRCWQLCLPCRAARPLGVPEKQAACWQPCLSHLQMMSSALLQEGNLPEAMVPDDNDDAISDDDSDDEVENDEPAATVRVKLPLVVGTLSGVRIRLVTMWLSQAATSSPAGLMET